VLERIDHIVVVVRNLDGASADYARAGFTVTPGGEHVGGATHNALISFADGTYFELIAFARPDEPQEHRWWKRLARGEGLVDYALLASDLDAEAARVRAAGLPLRGPADGGRVRPDGETLVWRSFFLGPGVGESALPFVIQDVTPRQLRVPGGPATRHRLGVTRVAGLSLVVASLDRASAEFAALLGAAGEPIDPRGEGAAVRFGLGQQWLELVEPANAASSAGRRLASLGEGPHEVVLSRAGGAAPGEAEPLAADLPGARIRVAG
jgi:Glyoxalase-like domain